jgi:peptidylprolyl isomerase
MRRSALSLIAVFAISACGSPAFAQSTTSQGTAPKTTAPKTKTNHRPTARLPRVTVPVDPQASIGLAAVGTMPAATGPSEPLYTLRYIDLKVGTGELARTSAQGAIVFYTVHYTGWLTDGTKFDSSVDRNEPFVFPVGAKRVITAWDTGFEGMRVGGKRRLIVPYQLAYGVPGSPPVIPSKATLIFDVELLGQDDTPQPVIGEAPTAARTGAPAAAAPAKPSERPEEHQE